METRLESLEATDILGPDPAIGSAGGKLYSDQVRICWMRYIELRDLQKEKLTGMLGLPTTNYQLPAISIT